MKIDGEKVREIRVGKGYSQEKLALLCDVNRRTIQRAESGKSLSLENASFLADALEVPISVIRVSEKDAEKTTLTEAEEIEATIKRGNNMVHQLTRIRRDGTTQFYLAAGTTNIVLAMILGQMRATSENDWIVFVLCLLIGLAVTIKGAFFPRYSVQSLVDREWQTFGSDLSKKEAGKLVSTLEENAS